MFASADTVKAESALAVQTLSSMAVQVVMVTFQLRSPDPSRCVWAR